MKTIKSQEIKEEKKSAKSIITALIIYIIIVMVSINFIRELRGLETNFYFHDMLNFLVRISNQQIDIPFMTIVQINADWGVFEFLRILINTFSSVLSLILYIGQSLINIAIFIGNVITILFT